MRALDGSFDYQMRVDSWHILILYWRPEEVWINYMVKTSEGGWSHVDDWKESQYRHPDEARDLLGRRPKKLLIRIRDRIRGWNCPLEDHVNWVLETVQAGAYTARGVT